MATDLSRIVEELQAFYDFTAQTVIVVGGGRGRLIDYVQALLNRSRRHAGVRVGLSPRAGIALLRGARAYALLLGRNHALPEDVQALFGAVAAHRLVAESDADPVTLAKAILHAVPVD